MKSEALKVWISLFTDTIYEIWQKEREELKKVAMVVEAAKCEFKRIEFGLETQLDCYRTKLQTTDCNSKKCANIDTISAEIKDSVQSRVSVEPCPKETVSVSNQSYLNQPITEVDLSLSTDEDTSKSLTSPIKSPNLNKNRKFCRKNKELCFSGSCQSPSSFDEEQSINLMNMYYKMPKAKKQKGSSLSVIENTPNCELPKKAKNSFHSRIKKKAKQKDSSLAKYSNILQVYPPLETTLSSGGSIQKKCDDLDTGTLMEIDDIIEHINKKEPDASINVASSSNYCPIQNRDSDDDFLDSTFENIVPQKNRSLKNKENSRPSKSKITCTFAKDYDRFPKKKESPPPKFVHKTETVRGKARMQLQGWTCKECKDFYELMGLPAEKIKEKINACSKHRNKFRPLDDTPPGFWDIATPPT